MGVRTKVQRLGHNPIEISKTNSTTSPNNVRRSFDPMWKKRGWHRDGRTYLGYFRTRYGVYKGIILERFIGYTQFFIFNPPKCLKYHSHSICFFYKGDNKYEVHFTPKPKCADEGIMAIERVLTEAHILEIKKKKGQYFNETQ